MGGIGNKMNIMKPDLNFLKPRLNFMKRSLNLVKHGFNIVKLHFHFVIRPSAAARGRREAGLTCPRL